MNITILESRVIRFMGNNAVDTINSDKLEDLISDNMSGIFFRGFKKLISDQKRTKGVLASLVKKGLVFRDDDGFEPYFILTDFGLKTFCYLNSYTTKSREMECA